MRTAAELAGEEGQKVDGARLVRRAEVVTARGAELEVRLDDRVVSARLAVPTPLALSPGDIVLVATEDEETRYAIGVLRQLREADVLATTADGATVRLRDDDGVQTLSVTGPDGSVWFEHRPSEGRSVVHAPSLTIRAESGHLDLHAKKKVRVHGEEGVELRSPRAVTMVAGEGDETSSFGLSSNGARLAADALDARLGRADARVDGEARLRGELVETTAEVVSVVAGVLTTRAERIVERAKESYSDISGLAQMRASQMRLIAEKTFRVLGERTLFKAKKDMKLKGETIYLD